MQLEPKDFAEWYDLPVTRYVMAAVEAQAAREMAAWQEQAWEDNLDPEARLMARERVRLANTFIGNTFEDWKAINDPEA